MNTEFKRDSSCRDRVRQKADKYEELANEDFSDGVAVARVFKVLKCHSRESCEIIVIRIIHHRRCEILKDFNIIIVIGKQTKGEHPRSQ